MALVTYLIQPCTGGGPAINVDFNTSVSSPVVGGNYFLRFTGATTEGCYEILDTAEIGDGTDLVNYMSSNYGDCVACLDICPTQAIVAPYQVDARRCVSYLTIELQGSIPEPYRKLIGNRIYGCDDCQIVCPWNRFAKLTAEADFNPRQQLNTQQLLDVFAWSEETFLAKTEGSAIRRIGHQRWLRNTAVALGNAPVSEIIIDALKAKLNHPSEMVREHVQWALAQHNL